MNNRQRVEEIIARANGMVGQPANGAVGAAFMPSQLSTDQQELVGLWQTQHRGFTPTESVAFVYWVSTSVLGTWLGMSTQSKINDTARWGPLPDCAVPQSDGEGVTPIGFFACDALKATIAARVGVLFEDQGGAATFSQAAQCFKADALCGTVTGTEGKQYDCGTCPSGKACNAAGRCERAPTKLHGSTSKETTPASQREGYCQEDGDCPSGQVCDNGNCVASVGGSAAPTLPPQTCTALGAACGQMKDVHGNAVDCGTCPVGQHCTSAHQCAKNIVLKKQGTGADATYCAAEGVVELPGVLCCKDLQPNANGICITKPSESHAGAIAVGLGLAAAAGFGLWLVFRK